MLIFMELQDGSLGSLLENKKEIGSSQQVERVAQLVLEQMLQALDFLACHDVIHRDVKPDNILYHSGRGDVRFQLGDFGLCNPYKNVSVFGSSFTPIPHGSGAVFGMLGNRDLDWHVNRMSCQAMKHTMVNQIRTLETLPLQAC